MLRKLEEKGVSSFRFYDFALLGTFVFMSPIWPQAGKLGSIARFICCHCPKAEEMSRKKATTSATTTMWGGHRK